MKFNVLIALLGKHNLDTAKRTAEYGGYGLLFACAYGDRVYIAEVTKELEVVFYLHDLKTEQTFIRSTPLAQSLNRREVAVLQKVCFELSYVDGAVVGEYGKAWASQHAEFEQDNAAEAAFNPGLRLLPALFPQIQEFPATYFG